MDVDLDGVVELHGLEGMWLGRDLDGVWMWMELGILRDMGTAWKLSWDTVWRDCQKTAPGAG